MIFDPDSPVRPRDLGDREINRRQGQELAKALSSRAVGRRGQRRDEQTVRQQQRAEESARLLFYNELSLVANALIDAQTLLSDMSDAQTRVRKELQNAQQNAELTTVRNDVAEAAKELQDHLVDAHRNVENAQRELLGVRDEQMRIAGLEMAWRYDGSDHDYRMPDMTKVGALCRRLEAAQEAFDAAGESCAASWRELQEIGRRRTSFFHSDQSVTLRAIDAFSWRRFEQFVATLAEDDGFFITQRNGKSGDRGGDVIGESADDRRLVAQCKHSPDPDHKVGSPELQKLNGNAKLVHRGHIAVLVTNQGFTKDAVEFAADQDIHLVGREELRRWATWGDPLMSILGLPPLPARPVSIRAAA